MKVKNFIPALMAGIIIISGCQNNTLPLPSGNNTGTSTGNNNSNTNPVVNTVSTPIGEFKFKKVETDKLVQYNQLVSQSTQNNNKGLASNVAEVASSNASGSATPAIAPMASSAGGASTVAPMAPMVRAAGDSAVSSSMAFPVSYFPYSGAFEEYTVVDFEEARSSGFVGSYAEIISKIIKPTISSIASDARMTNANGNLDKNGLNKNLPQPTNSATPMPYYYGGANYQWSFTFVSSSKKEVYNFYVSSTETLILRQKWGLKDLALDSIKIDSSEAIKILTNAIKDKSMNSTQNQYLGTNSELLYDIPSDKDVSWNLYMELEKNKVIWNVNMNINYSPYSYPYPMPLAVDGSSGSGVAPAGSSVVSSDGTTTSIGNAGSAKPEIARVPDYYYSGAYARIDAETGKILMFNRPNRTKYEPYPVYSGYSGPDYPVGIATSQPAVAPPPSTPVPMPAEVKQEPVVTK
ncbi:MAG: hypothetical protein AABZ74_03055 [Cyanobacteriota bacterium]